MYALSKKSASSHSAPLQLNNNNNLKRVFMYSLFYCKNNRRNNTRMLSQILSKPVIHPKYQICLITPAGRSGTILRHLYTSPRTGATYFSRHHANNYTHEQATAVLQNLPYPDAFIQSEYDCHYRETDERGSIKDYMCA